MRVDFTKKSQTGSWALGTEISSISIGGGQTQTIADISIDGVKNYDPEYMNITDIEYSLNSNSVNLSINYGGYYISRYYQETGNALYFDADFLIKVNGETLVDTTITGSYTEDVIYNATKSIACNIDGSSPDITIYGKVTRRVDNYPYIDENTAVYSSSKVHNGHVKVNSTWKDAFGWLKVNGVWKRCLIWKKISGAWKKGK